jgi:hypothetical protein
MFRESIDQVARGKYQEVSKEVMDTVVVVVVQIRNLQEKEEEDRTFEVIRIPEDQQQTRPPPRESLRRSVLFYLFIKWKNCREPQKDTPAGFRQLESHKTSSWQAFKPEA